MFRDGLGDIFLLELFDQGLLPVLERRALCFDVVVDFGVLGCIQGLDVFFGYTILTWNDFDFFRDAVGPAIDGLRLVEAIGVCPSLSARCFHKLVSFVSCAGVFNSDFHLLFLLSVGPGPEVPRGELDNYQKNKIPDNMFIWATMNSADQGVFPITILDSFGLTEANVRYQAQEIGKILQETEEAR